MDGAPIATHGAVTGTDKGALIRFVFEHGLSNGFFLNCATALRLVLDLYGAVREQNWWTEQPRRSEQDNTPPTDADVWSAIKVLSPRTDSTPEGALVSFGTGRTVSQFFIPKRVVYELVAGLRGLAEQAGWWDDKMQLIPADRDKFQ